MILKRLAVAVIPSAVLIGCASTDRVLRPEHVTYVPWEAQTRKVKITSNEWVELKCLDKRDGLAHSEPVSEGNRCLYYSIDERSIFDAFGNSVQSPAQLAALRNTYVSFLLNISEKNCTTFLNRAFASKSEMDTSSRTFNDVLTGLSAASANAQPHAAAGLSVANLIIGKTVDNVNSTYYFEKTFQALAASIQAERSELKETLIKKTSQSITDFTIYDALTAVHRFDNACSIRIGLEKLQGIAQDAATKNATIAEKTKLLDRQSNELTSTKAEVSNLTNKLVTLAENLTNTQDEAFASAFKKLKSAKNNNARQAAIAEIEGILRANEANKSNFESTADELKKAAALPGDSDTQKGS